MIGTLGDYEFEVSSEKVKTFRDLKFSNSAAYTEHKVHGRKAVLEFTGLNASTASLTVSLDIAQGVDPMTEITRFYEAMNNHEALGFTLGGEVMGEGLWVIESLDEDYEVIGGKGEVLRATVSLKLREYVDEE